MINEYTREKILLPRTIKPKDRVRIAEVIIDLIITRSAAGYDKNNELFPEYSEKYAELKGVGVKDVDLILSGEMLESLELVKQGAGYVTIGYKKPSKDLAGKIEGNRLGSYGGEPNEDRARDFLGISSDELDVLIGAYQDDEPITQSDINILAEQLADDLFGDL
jgi:hypothetical protein